MSSRFFFFTASLIALCCSFALAQRPGGGGNGGGGSGTGSGSPGGSPNFSNGPMSNTASQGADLQVRLTWPNQHPVDDIVHVQLLSSTNSPIMDTYSEHDGMVEFHSVVPGNYRLKIDGSNIKEMTTDLFEIGLHQRMLMEWVEISPKDDQATPVGGGAMVSAVELNAPPKARKEFDKGVAALTKGDLQQAEARFRKAVEIYPKYGRAWSNLGVILMREKDEPGARQAWMKAIEVDDKLPSGYLNLARLDLDEKKLPEAAVNIAKTLAFDPTNTEAVALLAKEELAGGRIRKSVGQCPQSAFAFRGPFRGSSPDRGGSAAPPESRHRSDQGI